MNNWINVEDDLPENKKEQGYFGEEVLVWNGQFMWLDSITMFNKWRYGDSKFKVPISHWMPRPEPPNEKS